MTAHQIPQSTLDWLILSLIPGLGPKTLQQFTQYYPTPADILTVLKMEYKHLPLNVKAKQWLDVHHRDIHKALAPQYDKTLAWLQHEGHLISFDQTHYPALLQQIYDPPVVLYVKGHLERLESCQNIAMIGSRKASKLGVTVAHRLSYQLAANGWNVVSGMAMGIDTASHQGALAAYEADASVAECTTASTVGVVATGLDIEYPTSNKTLYQQLYQGGCVVSEFPLGTQVNARLFPRRNRIISGLSLGVLVVEAAIRSGSLVTTKYAAEQGREVFAVPGNIDNPQASGCHYLIQHGAKLVQGLDDVLHEFESDWSQAIPRDSKHHKGFADRLSAHIRDKKASTTEEVSASLLLDPPTPPSRQVPEQHQALLNVMLRQPNQACIRADELILISGHSWPELSGQLLELEMLGLIRSVAGGYVLEH